MKILTGDSIKKIDLYTIENEPISSIDLMERASLAIAKWFVHNINAKKELVFLVGKGNNGGDGLAVARILSKLGYRCLVFLVFDKSEFTVETLINYNRLPSAVRLIEKNDLEEIPTSSIIVDALLGTGVKSIVKEPIASIINSVNALVNDVVSIDLPSGMLTEFGNADQLIVNANHTLCLQFPKLSMLLPEAGECCGQIHILPIGLSDTYLHADTSPFYFVDADFVRSRLLTRPNFGYKNNFGHSLLICGSLGMMGAAVLATKAALRSGCGLVTTHVPISERQIMQTACPSAMLSLDIEKSDSVLPNSIEKYTAIGCGCGLGQAEYTISAIKELLKNSKCPMVLDADALNIIANNSGLELLIPENSILTPHLGELRRLVGAWTDEEQKLKLVSAYAEKIKSVVVVKGAYTMNFMPNGACYVNSTGNAGMAKGGSGDVLTGFITGLLARGYSSTDAAIIGVFFHGYAGDKAARQYGVESMNSEDIIEFLWSSFPESGGNQQ